MESNFAAQAFATLGHTGRLSVFRLLMRFTPNGVRPTEIAKALDIKANTLSHYLADLTDAGLINVERQGRSLLYRVDLHMTQSILSYAALDMARGRPDLLAEIAQDTRSPTRQTKPWNVLFVCTGNSARSLFAEALLRDLGHGKFRAFSAGTHNAAQANPTAIEILKRNGHDISDLKPKPLDPFQGTDGPQMDFVFTVCDSAASEDFAPWPMHPITAHWGLPDPVQATGTDAEKALAFKQTYDALYRKISAFVALPFDSLTRIALQHRVDHIDSPHLTQE